MRTSDFDYALPDELIAQEPLEPRDAARLLVVRRAARQVEHRRVRDLPRLLEPGDFVVANRSRVLPARVTGTLRGGGRAEVLLLRRLDAGLWEALGRPARRLRVGDRVQVTSELSLRIERTHAEGLREVRVETGDANLDRSLLAAGDTPLPPYIRDWHGDPERYQTMFADVDGSAAAPTAGLHFTTRLVQALSMRGIDIGTVLLHVGLDTFRPISHPDPARHRMHREWYSVPPPVQMRIAATRAAGRRVVAIGTTSVRALEAWATTGNAEGETDLFITPGFHFEVVDGLLTNFHLPRSTLLMLVSAFAGRERVLSAYDEAIRARYRFFSFGDATLLL
jgi:S-adenosylmethionine:tRNA ribosyltransferase-isomerase